MERKTLSLVFLLLITLMAFGLRIYRLDHQSLWYDEGFSVYLASMGLGEITARTASDIHPPLYYYLLHFWLGPFGRSEFSLRFFSLAWGLLTVPLLYLLGRRLLGATAGLLAAFLASISPLYLWYSQEARMYTLVTFLCLATSYLLLRGLEEGRKGALFWGLYVLLNILAVYSHFFAFFILAFQGLFLLAWSLKERRWSPLAWGLTAQGLVVLAYLPWSGFVLRRYAADVSYWRGELNLLEVLRKTLILFSTGHTILESIAQPIALAYAGILLCALLLIAFKKRTAGGFGPLWRLLFLLLYLSLPVALLFLISYQRPKFHPRYLLLASPAFFLILAGGMADLIKSRRLPFVLGVIFLSFLAATSAYSDLNAYFDIRFTKDDFRSAARYIDSHIKEDEVVILTSGHLFPVFTYYYDKDNWYPIPDEPTLSTEHVLGFEVADDLNGILAGKRGVWLLLWQDDVVDPNGFLTMMLGEEGKPLPFEGGFWGLKLYHYALPQGLHFSPEPKIEHPVSVNFGDKIEFLGYSVSKTDRRRAEVILYWQALQELKEDYKIALRLADEAGHYWGRVDARPASYWYPTTRWSPGEKLFGKHTIETLPGTSPGEYRLELSIYTEEDPRGLDVLDEQGTPLGKSQDIGPLLLPPAGDFVPLEEVEGEIGGHLQATLVAGLTLVGYSWEGRPVQPGDTIQFTLFWQAVAEMEEDYAFRLQLLDAGGQMIDDEGVYRLGTEFYPTSRWQPGEVVRGQYDYTIPAWPVQPQPGEGRLELVLLDAEGERSGDTSLFSLEILETERLFEPPSSQYALPQGTLGGLVSLVGYNLSTEEVRAGDTLRLTLYWESLAPIDKLYTVFTHLLDSGSQVRAQKDSLPVGGTRPTTGWVPGEYIVDEYELVVDGDAPPGGYLLEVGMYEASTGERLLAFDEEGNPVDTRILLPTEIRVTGG